MPRPAAFVPAAAAALAATALSLIVGCTPLIPAGTPAGGRPAGAQMMATLVPTPDPSLRRVTASPTRAEQWVAASCATGEFTEVWSNAHRNAILTASVSLCAPYAPKYNFTLVAFPPMRDRAIAHAVGLRPYNADGPTLVQGAIPETPTPGELAVCAMRSLTDRIACVRLTFHPNEPTTMEPVPVDHPLVSKPVFLQHDKPPGFPWGFCGSCLPLP